MNVNDLVFAGLNGRVAALDRARGRIVWQWRSPKPTRGFVTLMLDGDRLLAGLGGYLYCLDPATGRLLWENPLTGFGLGIFSFASVRGSTHPAGAAQQAADDESSDAAAAGSAVG